MPLDDRSAFKFGFLLKCAEAGLSPDATAALVEKAAVIKEMIDGVRTFGLPALAMGVDGIKNLGMAGLAGAAGIGAGGGLLAAHLQQPTIDPEEVKKQELIAAYNTFSEQMKQEQRLRERPAKGQLRVGI